MPPALEARALPLSSHPLPPALILLVLIAISLVGGAFMTTQPFQPTPESRSHARTHINISAIERYRRMHVERHEAEITVKFDSLTVISEVDIYVWRSIECGQCADEFAYTKFTNRP